MKLLVFNLYFTVPKAQDPLLCAFWVILIFILVYLVILRKENKKMKFWIFLKIYGQKWLYRMIPMIGNYQFHSRYTFYVWITYPWYDWQANYCICTFKCNFFSILDSAYAILVLCSRQVLAMSKSHFRKYFSFIGSLWHQKSAFL